jgi:hypothetical protein
MEAELKKAQATRKKSLQRLHWGRVQIYIDLSRQNGKDSAKDGVVQIMNDIEIQWFKNIVSRCHEGNNMISSSQ